MTSAAEVIAASIDLSQDDFFQNPYPYYTQLRNNRRPFWLPHQQNVSSEGLWLFSRYSDCLQIYKSVGVFSKNVRAVRAPGTSTHFDLALLHRDGEDHLRLRRLVADYFSVQNVSRLESHITGVADALIADLWQRDSFDLLTDFAQPLPLRVIAHLMGLPSADLPQIRAWSVAMGDGFDSISATPELRAQQRLALGAFMDYIMRLLKERQSSPGDDLLSLLLTHQDRGNIQYDDLVAMAGFLLYAGHETTINLIANGLWLLLSHPQQKALLRAQPALMPGAVEEILRFESPEQRTSFRILLQPLTLAGVTLQPGQQVGMILGAANRDEDEFEDAENFDITRTSNRHLAFGVGIHHCIGKTLARLEAQIALRCVLAQGQTWQLTQERPVWRRNSFFRGMAALPARQQYSEVSK